MPNGTLDCQVKWHAPHLDDSFKWGMTALPSGKEGGDSYGAHGLSRHGFLLVQSIRITKQIDIDKPRLPGENALCNRSVGPKNLNPAFFMSLLAWPDRRNSESEPNAEMVNKRADDWGRAKGAAPPEAKTAEFF